MYSNIILRYIEEMYMSQSAMNINRSCCITIDKKKVISQNKNEKYVKELKDILSKIGNFYEEAKDKSRYSETIFIKRLLYKDSESKDGVLCKTYKFNNFNSGGELYIICTTIGTRNDMTIKDLQKRIKKRGGDFYRYFKIQDKGELKPEMEITLNVNYKRKYIYHFVIAYKNEIIIGEPFSFISQKQIIKRTSFLETKLEQYKNQIESDIFYYYNIFYNDEKKDFNEKFIFDLKFCSKNDFIERIYDEHNLEIENGEQEEKCFSPMMTKDSNLYIYPSPIMSETSQSSPLISNFSSSLEEMDLSSISSPMLPIVNEQNYNTNKESYMECERKFIGNILSPHNGKSVIIGEMYLENNEINIKAYNNMDITIGKIISDNVYNYIILAVNKCTLIGGIILNGYLYDNNGNNVLGVFDEENNLYLDDLNNLLAVFLIFNSKVMPTIDGVNFLNGLN